MMMDLQSPLHPSKGKSRAYLELLNKLELIISKNMAMSACVTTFITLMSRGMRPAKITIVALDAMK